MKKMTAPRTTDLVSYMVLLTKQTEQCFFVQGEFQIFLNLILLFHKMKGLDYMILNIPPGSKIQILLILILLYSAIEHVCIHWGWEMD